MLHWRPSKTTVPGSRDKGQPKRLHVQRNQISRGKGTHSILCHQSLFQCHWEVPSAQAAFPSPPLWPESKTFVRLCPQGASGQLTAQTFNLKRNLHTKLLITILYFGNILLIINTFAHVSSANSQLSPHLQTPGTGADSEGAGAEDRGSVLYPTVAKSRHSLTLNCFLKFSKSLFKAQSCSSQHNGSSAVHFLIPQYKNSQEREREWQLPGYNLFRYP